jgi:pimeloyl-ACP methyl ester carboxylesterase
MIRTSHVIRSLVVALVVAFSLSGAMGAPAGTAVPSSSTQVLYRTVEIDGLEIFYREAGRKDAPTLLVWGRNDEIFPAEGAHPYKKDLKNLEFHLLDTGHFALEEDGGFIAAAIRSFLNKNLD